VRQRATLGKLQEFIANEGVAPALTSPQPFQVCEKPLSPITQGSARDAHNPGLEVANAFGVLISNRDDFVDYFLSIEFQQTGYLVERIYKVSYGDVNGNSTLGGAHALQVPVVRFPETDWTTRASTSGWAS
jgi:hypothetical protein